VAAPGFSILGSDTAIKGDISAESDLHIDGRIEGDVRCNALVQGETSEIVGAVCVGSARLAGKVRGTIAAGDLVILSTARIEGDVEYDTLTIEPGAQVGGHVKARRAASAHEDAEALAEPKLTLASSAQ